MHLRNFDPTRPDPRVDPTRVHPWARLCEETREALIYRAQASQVRRSTLVTHHHAFQPSLLTSYRRIQHISILNY